MHTLRRGLLVLGALVAVSAPLAAKTLTFDNEKCHFDVPDDWIAKDAPNIKALYVNADATKSVVFTSAQNDNETLDDPNTLKQVDTGIESNGATIVNRQHLTLGGVNAYVLDTSATVPAGTSYARSYFAISNGYVYNLTLSKLGANAWEDDELNGIASSFAFTETTPAPDNTTPSSTPDNSTPSSSSPDSSTPTQDTSTESPKRASLGQRISYYVGTLVGVVAILALVRWITRGGNQ